MNKISIRCYKDNWENRIGSDVLNFFFIGYIFLTLIFRKGFSGEVTIKSSDVNLKARSQLSDIYRQEHFRWEEHFRWAEQDDQRLVGNRNRKGDGEAGAVGVAWVSKEQGFLFL